MATGSRNEDTALVWGRIPIIDAHSGSRAGLCCYCNVRGFELRASRSGGPWPAGWRANPSKPMSQRGNLTPLPGI
jgi:hypothetical protein